jgi:hypothetical protein
MKKLHAIVADDIRRVGSEVPARHQYGGHDFKGHIASGRARLENGLSMREIVGPNRSRRELGFKAAHRDVVESDLSYPLR